MSKRNSKRSTRHPSKSINQPTSQNTISSNAVDEAPQPATQINKPDKLRSPHKSARVTTFDEGTPSSVTNFDAGVLSSNESAQDPKSQRASFIFALAAIVVLAFVLRVIKLTEVPYGFFCDEADIAMDAYSLGHTFRDKDGTGSLLPFFIEGMGQFRGAFHTYCVAPFIRLLGMSEFSVRFAAAVSGTLTVLFTGLFVTKALNRTVGLMSAFLLAVSPWHLMHSRAGWDVISLPFLIALFLTFFFYGLERPRYLIGACICAALGMYGYFAGRLFFPLFCVVCLCIYAVPLLKQWRIMLIGFVLAAIVLIPTFLAIKNGTFFSRVNELSDQTKTYAEIIATFKENYRLHFTPAFLLNTTTDPIHRHFIQGWGMIYIATVPFLILGALAMLVRSFTPLRRREDLLFLVWFLIFPLACALVSAPISTRAIGGVIVFQIAIAEGIYLCMLAAQWLARRLSTLQPYRTAMARGVCAVTLVAISFNATRFMQFYLNDYPRVSSDFWGWQWGVRPMIEYFKAHSTEYDSMYMSTEFNAPGQLFKFFTWPDPMGAGTCAKCNLSDAWLWWISPEARDNAFNIAYNPELRQLWAVSPEGLKLMQARSLRLQIKEQINYPNNEPAFYFVATGLGV